MQHVVGTTNLLLAGTVLRLQLKGRGGILGTTGLLHLGTYLRGVENSQRVASLHEVAFLDAYLQNTARHLAGHAVFTHFYLPLDQFRITSKGKESNHSNNDNHCCKANDGE